MEKPNLQERIIQSIRDTPNFLMKAANASKSVQDRCMKTKKVCYGNKKDVQTILNKTKKKRGEDGAKRFYFCSFCRSYHLTSLKIYEKKEGNYQADFEKWKHLL